MEVTRIIALGDGYTLAMSLTVNSINGLAQQKQERELWILK